MAGEYHKRRKAGDLLSTYECAKVMRAACGMLHVGPAQSIRAVSLTCPTVIVAETAHEVEIQGRLLAEEYCLCAEAFRGERTVTIRFSLPSGAEDLGAKVIRRTGGDVAEELARVPVEQNADSDVIGRSHRGRLERTIWASVVDKLLRLISQPDVVVAGDRER
jgi:hypothetical protein